MHVHPVLAKVLNVPTNSATLSYNFHNRANIVRGGKYIYFHPRFLNFSNMRRVWKLRRVMHYHCCSVTFNYFIRNARRG